MYIVRWLMGHPILATWFVGAIAILLSIGNHGANKDVHVDDHANTQQQVETTHTTKTLETPSAVTSALIESDEKKVIVEGAATPAVKTVVETVEKIEETASTSVETKSTEVEASEVESTEIDKAEAPSKTADSATTEENTTTQEEIVVTEEVVTETTVDSTVATNRSYPDGLSVGPGTTKTESTEEASKAVVETEAGKTGTQADVAVAATEAASTLTETPKPEEVTADSKSIEDLGQSSTEQMLLMAREAYWNNGLEEASQIYTQLIELEPTVIEYRGELGNVYWRQGFPKKAAKLYAEISLPMIEQGNQDRVANMVGFIGLFYPEKATEIHNKLQAGK